MYKHCILLMCYNQEKLIKNALDSIFDQSTLPSKVVIGDDASTDGTYDILIEYKNKYKNIIHLYQNQTNLGIQSHTNKIIKMADGDIIHWLAGDDKLGFEFIKNSNEFIKKNQLDVSVDQFMLLPKIEILKKNGKSHTLDNNHLKRKKNGFVGLAIRENVVTKYVGISRKLFDKWPLYVESDKCIGPYADFYHYIKFAQHVEKYYVMDSIGYSYREGIGISSNYNHIHKSYLMALHKIQREIKDNHIKINKKINLSFIKVLISIFELRYERERYLKTLSFVLLLSIVHCISYPSDLLNVLKKWKMLFPTPNFKEIKS